MKKLFKKLVIFSFLHKFFFSKKQFTNLRVRLNGGVEKWENRKLREDGKYSVFPLVCLVGEVEKWEGWKLFCLVGEKNGMMKNVIYINWLLYPYYIISKK